MYSRPEEKRNCHETKRCLSSVSYRLLALWYGRVVKHQQKSLRLLVRSSHLFAKVISSSEEVSGSEETGSKGGRLAGGLAYALGLVCSGCMALAVGDCWQKKVLARRAQRLHQVALA